MDLTCPVCNAPVYSSKAALCGRCEAPLPAELLMRAQRQATALTNREWAQEIANRAVSGVPLPPPKPKIDPVLLQNLPPELLSDIIPRDYAVEFENRKRPMFWFHVIGAALFLVFIEEFALAGLEGKTKFQLLLLMGAFSAFILYQTWKTSDPNCPNCHKDIRRGRLEHCYQCGTKLRDRHCPQCVVDYGWLGKTAAIFNSAYAQKVENPIANCPHCGVYLDTPVYRWATRKE